MNNPRARALEVLISHNAPMPAARRIVDDMDAAGLFSSTGLFGDDVAESLVAAVVLRERVEDLADELAASKSPAIRGAAKKLTAVLEDE